MMDDVRIRALKFLWGKIEAWKAETETDLDQFEVSCHRLFPPSAG